MRRSPTLNYPIKLDIGCGRNKITDFVGFDKLDFGQEIAWDINDGIPLPNDSVLVVHCSHFIEHLKPEELPNFFSEIVRVCKNGSQVILIAPHSSSIQSHYLCHYSFWDEPTIKGICEDSPNLVLVSTEQKDIHFTINLVVKK